VLGKLVFGQGGFHVQRLGQMDVGWDGLINQCLQTWGTDGFQHVGLLVLIRSDMPGGKGIQWLGVGIHAL